MDFHWEPYHFSQATGINKPHQAHDRSGTWQRTEKLQRKSRSVSHLFTQQQSTSMTTSWHLYLVARFSRVSTSSTRRTYSCSTCERQENVSAPFHSCVLPHALTHPKTIQGCWSHWRSHSYTKSQQRAGHKQGLLAHLHRSIVPLQNLHHPVEANRCLLLGVTQPVLK